MRTFGWIPSPPLHISFLHLSGISSVLNHPIAMSSTTLSTYKLSSMASFSHSPFSSQLSTSADLPSGTARCQHTVYSNPTLSLSTLTLNLVLSAIQLINRSIWLSTILILNIIPSLHLRATARKPLGRRNWPGESDAAASDGVGILEDARTGGAASAAPTLATTLRCLISSVVEGREGEGCTC